MCFCKNVHIMCTVNFMAAQNVKEFVRNVWLLIHSSSPRWSIPGIWRVCEPVRRGAGFLHGRAVGDCSSLCLGGRVIARLPRGGESEGELDHQITYYIDTLHVILREVTWYCEGSGDMYIVSAWNTGKVCIQKQLRIISCDHRATEQESANVWHKLYV